MKPLLDFICFFSMAAVTINVLSLPFRSACFPAVRVRAACTSWERHSGRYRKGVDVAAIFYFLGISESGGEGGRKAGKVDVAYFVLCWCFLKQLSAPERTAGVMMMATL